MSYTISEYRLNMIDKKPSLIVKQNFERDHDLNLLTDQDYEQLSIFLVEELQLNESYIEYTYVFFYDAFSRCLGFYETNHGDTCSAYVSIRELFIAALLSGAKKIIFIHNHPGIEEEWLIPSEADIALTSVLEQNAKTLDMELVEHIIIGANGYHCLKKDETF